MLNRMCPECRSTNLVKNGKNWISRKPIQQYRCRNCGRITIYPVEVEADSRELKIKPATR